MKKVLKVFGYLIIILSVIAFFYIGKGYLLYKQALEKMSIFDRIEQIKSKENYCDINEVPQIYLDAVIAVEDHRYYKHHGVDYIAIARAFFHDLQALEFKEGGSTITQQLAKNLYFNQDKKIERKIAEIFMAYHLESKLSKEEILELYLNTSYYGDGYYTIKEASVGYFGKLPKDMNEYEAIMLAGIPNAPSKYAPTKSMKLAKERQRQVLNRMIKYHYLTEKEVEKILEQQKNSE